MTQWSKLAICMLCNAHEINHRGHSNSAHAGLGGGGVIKMRANACMGEGGVKVMRVHA